MGLSCCVPGCNHKNGRELCSLYNFPNENDGPDWKQWYNMWCERIGKSHRDGSGHGWMPTTWSRVCSCHFKEEERWKPRTRQPGLKFRAPVYFPFMSGASGSLTKSEPMNKTPLLAGLRVDTGMKSSLLAGLNVKIVPADNDKASDTETTQDSKPGSPSENDVQMKEETRKDGVKRESLDSGETSAKKSKLEDDDDDDDDVEMIEDDEEENLKDKRDVAATSKAKNMTKTKTEDDDVQMIEEDGDPAKAVQEKTAPKEKGSKTSSERLLKALTQPNSPALQIIHSSSASNSPVPMNMSSGQSSGSSASAYSSLVQMNAKSQIPVLSLSNRTVAPQSKYAELLAVIEDMGRDIRPTYSGSRTATERLKRGIVHARALVRECLAETERSARS
ncbi:nucleolin-like isoform X2 [Patiria miniata]|uniref:THAP-type domain-containing protein n=1 Tax=Patiria miniata TaxID=46514 RepID=A0A914BFU4_PATMI|nr:nucleolin-like isoform X2 [Patiria miniata]